MPIENIPDIKLTGLLQKMLSINVALSSVILVGFVKRGTNLVVA